MKRSSQWNETQLWKINTKSINQQWYWREMQLITTQCCINKTLIQEELNICNLSDPHNVCIHTNKIIFSLWQLLHHLSRVIKRLASAWHLAPSLLSTAAWSISRKPEVPTDPPIVCVFDVCHARCGALAHFDPFSKKVEDAATCYFFVLLFYFFRANYQRD